MQKRGLLLALLFALPLGVAAQTNASQQEVLSNKSFLSAHPDLQNRIRGMELLQAGHPDRAMARFQRAAWFADKPSQAMVATLYWEGRGVKQDRALGYAWMDLAAERQYPDFLLQRERYWNELNADEQARALDEGVAVYARYGDRVSQPRIAGLLRRERSHMTGSRAGFAGNTKVIVPGAGVNVDPVALPSVIVIDGSQFHDPQFWVPEQYQAWHDSQWTQPRMGRVEVGEFEQQEPAPSGSRIKTKPTGDTHD